MSMCISTAQARTKRLSRSWWSWSGAFSYPYHMHLRSPSPVCLGSLAGVIFGATVVLHELIQTYFGTGIFSLFSHSWKSNSLGIWPLGWGGCLSPHQNLWHITCVAGTPILQPIRRSARPLSYLPKTNHTTSWVSVSWFSGHPGWIWAG